MHRDEVIGALTARHAALVASIDELEAACRDASAERMRSVVHAIDDTFAACVRAEDRDVFPPILDAVPAAAASIHPLQDEHTELQEMLARLFATLGEAQSADRDEQVVVQVRDIVDLFHIHLRKEESIVRRLWQTDGPSSTKGSAS